MKFDIVAAETQYITDIHSTYRSIAEDFNVNYTYVAKVAADNNWIDKRQQYQSKVKQKANKRIEDEQVNEIFERTMAYEGLLDSLLKKMIDIANNEDIELNTMSKLMNMAYQFKRIESLQHAINKEDEEDNNLDCGVIFLPSIRDDEELDKVVYEDNHGNTHSIRDYKGTIIYGEDYIKK